MDDDVVDLREWATETIRPLPQPPIDECMIRLRPMDHGGMVLAHGHSRTTQRLGGRTAPSRYAACATRGGAMRRVSTATSAWVPSPWRRVTPENPTPGVTYSVLRRACEPMS